MLKLHEHMTTEQINYQDQTAIWTVLHVRTENKIVKNGYVTKELAIRQNEQEIFRVLYGDIVDALLETSEMLIENNNKAAACVQAWVQLSKIISDIQEATKGEQTNA